MKKITIYFIVSYISIDVDLFPTGWSMLFLKNIKYKKKFKFNSNYKQKLYQRPTAAVAWPFVDKWKQSGAKNAKSIDPSDKRGILKSLKNLKITKIQNII